MCSQYISTGQCYPRSHCLPTNTNKNGERPIPVGGREDSPVGFINNYLKSENLKEINITLLLYSLPFLPLIKHKN
jgi:hypothetical protein